MKEIRDPVHGYVKLDPLALKLVNAPEVQRLRWIKQLGLANLVYPGASHTRFEHSLGTYHLAMVLAEHLGLSEEEKLKIGVAAILHDVGHGPLSHATEGVLSAHQRQDHENISDLLRAGELGDILKEVGLLPWEIQELIRGKTELGQIISGEIDVDRMDYLIRDAHYTGVAYGVIDHLRLIGKMKIHLGRLAVDAGGIQAAESLLVSRLLMHPTVYFHHVCRISEAMISGGIDHMIKVGGILPTQIKRMDDMELFSAMISWGGYPSEMASRIKSRRLFKRAVYVGMDGWDQADRIAGRGERIIAQELAEEAMVDQQYVLVDDPPLPEVPEGNFPTVKEGKMAPLREVSPLVNIMEQAHRATWRFGVYTRPEDREKVSRAARRCLNIKRNFIQHTLEL